MGSRGPKPDPKAHGSKSAYRRKKAASKAPKLPPEAPDCPVGLSAEGKAEWCRQVEQLDRMGVITKIDRAVLCIYCQQWGEIQALNGLIKKQGRIVKGSMGSSVSNPLVKQREAAMDRLLEIAAQFGFTPASRSRLDVSAGGVRDTPEEGSLLAFARKRG